MSSDTWTDLTPMPFALAAAGSIKTSLNEIFVFGGYIFLEESNTSAESKKTFQFIPSFQTSEWVERTDLELTHGGLVNFVQYVPIGS